MGHPRLSPRVGALLVLGTSGVPACSSFAAEPSDAGAATDAGSARATGYFTDDFDALDCAGWRLVGLTPATDTTQKHSGNGSCRLCYQGTPAEPYLTRIEPARGAGTYLVVAWTRSPAWAGRIVIVPIKNGSEVDTNGADWPRSNAFERTAVGVVVSQDVDAVKMTFFPTMQSQLDDCFWLDELALAHRP